MASIEEVARLAGVSTATVSRALSGRGHVSPASRAKVEVASASLGYVVSSNASSLASGRTRNIGVVVPFLNRWFFIAATTSRCTTSPGMAVSARVSSSTSSCANAWTR